MRFLFDPIREKEQKLEKFRQSFHLLTSDGTYPPDRQQRLFIACKNANLDWDEARAYIAEDAVRFIKWVISDIIDDGRVSADEVAQLRRLQKRLLLPDAQVVPLFEQFFDLVERRLTSAILDQAAYLGEIATFTALHAEIAKYDLPAARAERLTKQINRQHELAALLSGQLPNIQASVSLFKNEVCHFDAPITVLTGGDDGALLEGRLILTSQRIMVLAPNGNVSLTWAQCRAVEILDRSLILVTSVQNMMLLCDDPQFVATLIVAARRRYAPQPLPEPLRAGKRLLP